MTILLAIASVAAVSAISFVGALTLSVNVEKLKKFLLLMVSFAAGALFGDVFLHLLPEIAEKGGIGLAVSLSLLAGIVVMFAVEKIIHWRHCHHAPGEANHAHTFAFTNLVGDGIHNFLDGLTIGVSYLVSIPVGVATTLAVILHEIPQEIGDFGVLLHGGLTKRKALLFNFATALLAVLGAIVALLLNTYTEHLTTVLVPFAAGGFLYIAGSDLIPELHKEEETKRSVLQFLAFLGGIGVMLALLLLE